MNNIKPGMLPNAADLPDTCTVGELAAALYPDITYDTALPQGWVDWMRDRGVQVVGNFVWGYPKGSFSGQPLPLTAQAAIEALKVVR